MILAPSRRTPLLLPILKERPDKNPYNRLDVTRAPRGQMAYNR
jgi:hypothetical protein